MSFAAKSQDILATMPAILLGQPRCMRAGQRRFANGRIDSFAPAHSASRFCQSMLLASLRLHWPRRITRDTLDAPKCQRI